LIPAVNGTEKSIFGDQKVVIARIHSDKEFRKNIKKTQKLVSPWYLGYHFWHFSVKSGEIAVGDLLFLAEK
jgi:hypothetical protein